MRHNALVVCLGDLGRSPRICNAARDLAQANHKVCLLGYRHTPPSKEIASHVTVAHIDDNPNSEYVARQITRIASLIAHLIVHKPYTLILIQNPPSVTVLWILLIYRFILNCVILNFLNQYSRSMERCMIVVDCHNYGWTLMNGGSKNSPKQILIKPLEQLELAQMRSCDRVLTVSRAMRDDLVQNHSFAKEKVKVYYDEPGQILSIPKENGVEVLKRYAPQCHANSRLRVLTSTSYTPDESVDWLVEAASEIGSGIELVITGKGPQYDDIKNLARQLAVDCHQIFVDHEDYYDVLASADVGVCLHRSSSGLDLPMKIVDMKKAAIPLILAYHYNTLEAEAQGIRLFKNKTQLIDQLRNALSKPPTRSPDQLGGVGLNDQNLVQCLFE